MVNANCEDRMLTLFSRRACPARGCGANQPRASARGYRPFGVAAAMPYPIAADGSRRLGTRGVTLIELLVVIGIIMILTVVVLPTMRPAAESRRIREAARAVNVALATARNRAIATGKPCGVIFERTPADGRFCTVLYQAEAPPPYTGDYVDSRIEIPSPNAWMKSIVITPNDNPAGRPDMILEGDILQLNYQGYCWGIAKRNGTNFTFDSTNRPFPPFAPSSNRLPFTVFRQPVKTAAEPLQLPAGVVVDLSCSGTDTAPNLFREPLGASPPAIKTVKVVFASDGSLGRCYWGTDDTNFALRYGTPTEPLYLLIGLNDRPFKPSSAAEDELPNWLVPTNLWISISPRTGLIATSENYYVDPTTVNWSGVDPADPSTWTPLETPINAARTYAKESQSMGGR